MFEIAIEIMFADTSGARNNNVAMLLQVVARWLFKT